MAVFVKWECDNCRMQLHYASNSTGVEMPHDCVGDYKGQGLVVEDELLCAHCRGVFDSAVKAMADK